jgi:glutathione peroxidase
MNPIVYFLESLNFLDWWLLAMLLAVMDVFFLRGWLVVLAIAAGLTGFVLMLFPQIGWPWQLGGCAALTLAGIAIHILGSAKSTSGMAPAISVIQESKMNSFYDFEIKTIDGRAKALKDFNGEAVLVVNVASECGLTPQYAGLEKLQREFKDRGFTVLGLPCNQFGKQEPGTEAQIKEFCSANYEVSFPLTSKIEVNGNGAHPLYVWLKKQTGGADIQWNFEKFLIGKDGRIVKRYSPKTVPEDPQLRADLEAAL